MLVAANALLTFFVGLYVHRIALHLLEKDDQIGRLLQTVFEKLESLPDFAQEFEAPNPFQAILAQIMSQKVEATMKGRGDTGQFTRAEIIPPE